MSLLIPHIQHSQLSRLNFIFCCLSSTVDCAFSNEFGRLHEQVRMSISRVVDPCTQHILNGWFCSELWAGHYLKLNEQINNWLCTFSVTLISLTTVTGVVTTLSKPRSYLFSWLLSSEEKLNTGRVCSLFEYDT
jgi:hypothetical protein